MLPWMKPLKREEDRISAVYYLPEVPRGNSPPRWGIIGLLPNNQEQPVLPRLSAMHKLYFEGKGTLALATIGLKFESHAAEDGRLGYDSPLFY